MPEHEISVVIPTKNRPEDLLTCVASIKEQSQLPHELLIIDDDNPSMDRRSQIRSGSIDVTITSSDGPPGSSTARNTGAEMATNDVILYLDDDTILAEDYLRRLHHQYGELDNDSCWDWRVRSGAAGVLAESTGVSRLLKKFINTVLYQNSSAWSINQVGLHSSNPTLGEPQEADYLSGYNPSYKRQVLLEKPFAYWSGGKGSVGRHRTRVATEE